jgi:hypothetical protein
MGKDNSKVTASSGGKRELVELHASPPPLSARSLPHLASPS